MQNNALLIDEVLSGVRLTNPEPSTKPAESSNVLTMPTQPGLRKQDVIVRLMLRGQTFAEIAQVVGDTEENVVKIARSEWTEKALTEYAKSSTGGDTVRNLIRAHSFTVVLEVARLAKEAKNEQVRLSACRLLLEHTLPTVKLDEKARDDGALDPMKEAAELDRRIMLLEKRNQATI